MKSGDTNDNDIKVNSDDLFTDSEDTEFRLDISEDFFDDNDQAENDEEEFKNRSFTVQGEAAEAIPDAEADVTEEASEPSDEEVPEEEVTSDAEVTEEEEAPLDEKAPLDEAAPLDEEAPLDEDEYSDPDVLIEEALLDGDSDTADVPSDDETGEPEEEFDESDFDEFSDDDEDVSEETDGEAEYDDEDFVELADDGSLPEEGSDEPSDGNGGDGDGEDSEVGFTDEGEEEETDEEEASSGFFSKKNLGLKIFLGFVAAVVIFAIWLLGTNAGRSFGLGIAAKFIKRTMDAGEVSDREANSSEINVDGEPYTGPAVIGDTGISIGEEELPLEEAIRQRASLLRTTPPRSEDYVKTYLLFGIEEIDGASNTDAIMLVSINTKDNTIKLTSILRDTLVDIPGFYPNKINSVYAMGAYNAESAAEGRTKGAALLQEVIERIFDVKISGYAFVNFNRFERIIDSLGGIDLQLGAEEAEYLRSTNYISIKENRKGIVEGWNYGLNGNQVLGYVRVRKKPTLGGADNDYGRTVRQRRVINAIIEKYKSVGLSDMLSIAVEVLGYVRTNLSEDQIKEILVDVVNNRIFTTKSSRVPYDNLFYDSGMTGVFNGKSTITWALVMDENIDENIKKLHQFIFLDEVEE